MKNIHKNNIHLEPPRGLLNDPNGLSYFRGKYHVFHQWNRFECNHSYKEWGLFTSENLIDWIHEGSAILPDSNKDRHGVYSGSAIVVHDKLRIFYTGNTKYGGIRKSYQCLASSDDGRTYLKFNSIDTPKELTEHHRDPKVYFYDNVWNMIVGSQTRDGIGAIALYTSSNLQDWKYENLLYEDKELDQMCECPDILDFEQQQVLLVCPQKRDLEKDRDISSYSGYYIGRLRERYFIPQSELLLLDEGFDFYAPQTFKDPKGRYLMWAWMSRMTEAEELICPTRRFNYIHCLTMPREVTLEHGVLYQRPLEEILERRKKVEFEYISSSETIFTQSDETLLLEINFKDKINLFQLNLAEEVEIYYYDGILYLKRRSWVNNRWQEKKKKLYKLNSLQIFLDQSALEIFINDGEIVMSLRYFPKTMYKKHRFTCDSEHYAVLSNINLREDRRKDG